MAKQGTVKISKRGRKAGVVDARQLQAAAKNYETAKERLTQVTERYLKQIKTQLSHAIG